MQVKNKICVEKRDGTMQPVHFDKVTERIAAMCAIEPSLDENYVDPAQVAQKVIAGIYDKVKTRDLDILAAETAAYCSSTHPDFAKLAARISVSNLHKETPGDISVVFERLYNYVHPITKRAAPLVSENTYNFLQRNKKALIDAIDYRKDFSYNYFGFKTLERSYLLRCNNRIVERPQDMLMRASIGIHAPDNCVEASEEDNRRCVFDCIETYAALSDGLFTHATPTLFNSGTVRPQMSSCFLLKMTADSVDGIYQTLSQCAKISKHAGGIGVAISTIRASESYISGTGGKSNGIVPMLRVFNDTARYIDQGGGKRKGAFAMYLEPWHADVFAFLDLRKNHGVEEQRARDLFYALWVPDLFMRRVADDGMWTLFCPNEAPGLADVHGKAFEELYERYEREQLGRETIPARKLWAAIIDTQMETGVPYMLYKDACNAKSNQQHLGTISSSNLCCEVVEYTAPDEIAVCNLASLALPKFVQNGEFQHEQLGRVVAIATRNLNKIIDKNYYPLPEARNSNLRHRPIGIGVQGLADVFCLLHYPFESKEAAKLNREIFETIYYYALKTSNELARKAGHTYETYQGSPLSQGKLQFDLWNQLPESERQGSVRRYDWQALRNDIALYGAMNSLLVAPMPTASTSQILGNNECIEPYMSNIFTRRVLAGEFYVVNEHLVRDLDRLGLWNKSMADEIVAERGSVQNIGAIPDDLKQVYKTVWEMSMQPQIDMAAERGIYICQSQSFNAHIAELTYPKLTTMHFYGWRAGLKTGMYYMRTKAAADPIQFTVNQQLRDRAQKSRQKQTEDEQGAMCTMADGCVSCGS